MTKADKPSPEHVIKIRQDKDGASISCSCGNYRPLICGKPEPSQELMELAREWIHGWDSDADELKLAQFGEHIVRQCAEIAIKNRHKDYSYDCSEDFRKGYELATQYVEEDILRKFGIEGKHE